MTDLKTLLDLHADAPTFATPDLDAVRAGGLRRRRRRYAGAATGALVAVAAASALVVGLLSGGGFPDARPDVATEPSAHAGATDLRPSWAVGTVIHDGDREIRVGHPVRAYVRTSLGYVTADDRGRVWSVVDGRERQIGVVADAAHPRLVSDPASSFVAWVDEPGRSGFVLHDQADGGRTVFVPLSSTESREAWDQTYLYALSDGVAYVRGGSDVLAVDLDVDVDTLIDVRSTTRRVVDRDVTPETDVIDAAAGQVLRGGAGDVPFPGGTEGAFSPDAGYLAVTDDQGGVYEARTGTPLDLGLGAESYRPVEWWGPTTLAVLAHAGDDAGGDDDLLRCDVVAGSCEPAADLGPAGSDVVLPTGTR